MNTLIVVSGIFALLTTMGHFAVGSKKFLKPMLEASFDPIAHKIMHCVFHYVSAFLILSTVALLAIGTGMITDQGTSLVVRFIAANYAVFAVWQIALASTSGIPNGLLKLFQWVFFILISCSAFAGASGL
ncbi:hypothetical protein ACFL6N_02955 [Thermodesulfobacteriota bacterium]